MQIDEQLERDLARENLSLASLSKRTRAFVADELLISLLVVLAFADRFTSTEDPMAIIDAVNSLFMVIMIMKTAYQTVFTYMYGATLGKMWQKIIVVETGDFGKPSFTTALNRALVRIFSEALFYFGFLWAWFDPKRQGWHDKIGRTLVLNA